MAKKKKWMKRYATYNYEYTPLHWIHYIPMQGFDFTIITIYSFAIIDSRNNRGKIPL